MNRREFAAALGGGASTLASVALAAAPPSAAGSSVPEALNHPRTAAEVAANVTPVDASYPPLDLRRYGADGSGSSSSDRAVADAIAACGASGGTIRVPGGHYVFSDQIDLAGRRSIIIAGEAAATGGAQAATHLTYAGSGSGVFINMDSAVGCQLRGLQISHRDPHYTGTYIKCGNAGGNDCSLCAIVDCVLGSNAGPGTLHLDLNKCIEFTAERCAFSFGNPSVRGQVSSSHGYANAIHFRDCQWTASHAPPVQDGGQAWSFEGCTFEGVLSGAAGALYSSAPVAAFNALSVMNCWFGDVSGAGAWLDIYGNGVVISGNYLSGNRASTTAIALHRCTAVNVTGNLFDQVLIAVDFRSGPCRGILVQGNVASLVLTGLGTPENVPTGSLVWGPNFGLATPGSIHERLAADGYCADAQAGLLRQWGTATLAAGASSHAVSFPLQFPGQCFNVVFSLSSGGHAPSAYVSRLSASGFVAGLQGVTDGATLYWQALGV